MNTRILDYYFFILFSLIPFSIILGGAVSLGHIILIDISFIFFILYKKEYKFLSNKTLKLIIFFCVYLIFNSIISKDFSIGALRNFGLIRFGVLFCAFNYFFYNKNYFNRILIIWSITLIILSMDAYLESVTGKNIFGYGEQYGNRIVSFFKDEPIVGGYINAFYLIIIGYFFNSINKNSIQYKNYILILSIFFLIAILLTGERSNTIKAILGFFIFYFFNDYFNIKQKAFSIFAMIMLVTLLFYSSDFLKKRYVGQFLNPLIENFQSKEKIYKQLEKNTYLNLYRSGYSVFKNYPLFGVGNKNYRLEACMNKIDKNYVCNSHPHQVYFEFLAEHGLIGSIILLFILFKLILSKIKIVLQSKNYIQIGCLIFLLTIFFPLLPSGSFFNDYNLTLFWINLSLMYSINKKTNIFYNN